MKKGLLNIFIILCMSFLIACTNDEHPVNSIEINADQVTLGVGDKHQIIAHVLPLSSILYNGLSYRSSDEQVAQVDADGLITARYSGDCVISVRANNATRKIKVHVKTVIIDLQLKKACIFSKGDSENWGYNTVTLQLLDPNLSFSTDYQTVIGNGLAVNLVGFLPFGSPLLKDGIYPISSKMAKETFYAGHIVENQGNYSVLGSFVGRYSEAGLSAIVVDSGQVKVTTVGDKRLIVVDLKGSKGEKISGVFQGDLKEINNLPQIYFDVRYTYTQIEKIASMPYGNQMRIKFQNATQDTLIYCVAIVPTTVNDYMPIGNYKLNESNQLFTLVKDSCYFEINTQKEKLIDGNIRVLNQNSKLEFDARLRSENLLIHLLK